MTGSKFLQPEGIRPPPPPDYQDTVAQEHLPDGSDQVVKICEDRRTAQQAGNKRKRQRERKRAGERERERDRS
jgi:hypothetical protein